MNSTTIWILGTFIAYMTMMMLIGVAYMKTGKSSEEYFLGGRSLGGWVVAHSAQASDMSGWLLMGLPGSVLHWVQASAGLLSVFSLEQLRTG